MAALPAVHSASHGIADQAVVHCRGFESTVHLKRWIEWRLGAFISYKFKTYEQTPPANVSHMGMLSKLCDQRLHQ